VISNEYRSDSAINVKILSYGHLSVSSDEEMSVTIVACSMAHGQRQVLSNHDFHLLPSLA
jgi:hypothetical protein